MPQSERLLVLLRHGQSEWNLKNLFTGWRDAASFQRISEYLDGKENTGGFIVDAGYRIGWK